MTDQETARECLRQINPSVLDYADWLATGMACKDAGVSFGEWDTWSARDIRRYKPREMQPKWNSFKGGGMHTVGVGSLVKLCRDGGGVIEATGGSSSRWSDPGHAIPWESTIGAHDEHKREELQVIRQEWLQDVPLPPAPDKTWDGRADLATYLRVLFDGDERVGIVTEAWESEPDGDGNTRWLPKKGVWDRSAGDLQVAVKGCKELGEVIGDWNPACGAWIRFNPLDGNGCADVNVTAYRFALVECDDVAIERQHAIYRELELPIAALVHSGSRSLHAIVRIEAPDFKEYQKRVDFLYDICKKNGLVVDRKNRNPSRLSRLPGATRDGKPQWLVSTNIGRQSWVEWADYIAALNDDLPDVIGLADVWDNLPPLADELIGGVLRMGHKMLLAGPSKAGKSFLLQRLLIAIAEGTDWLGWHCRQGRVLYVNLELDPASCLHRLKALYTATGIAPANLGNIDIWNLRGKALPMNELAPRLIRRAAKRNYVAVVIDPIYKVITGDENAAHEMALFCNQFDKVCAELGAATIYCHHHSKGGQGQKRAADRASGSGVFARDPDALLDLIELIVPEARLKQFSNRMQCGAMARMLNVTKPDWEDGCGQDDALIADKLAEWAIAAVGLPEVAKVRAPAVEAAEGASGWRVEGTLREFRTFKPRRIWFVHPTHLDDEHDLLKDALAEGEEPPRRGNGGAPKPSVTEVNNTATRNALDAVRGADGAVTLTALMEYLSASERTARTRLKNIGKGVSAGLVVDAAEAGREQASTPGEGTSGETPVPAAPNPVLERLRAPRRTSRARR